MAFHRMSPILSSVVHHTFQKACTEIGASPISLESFQKQISPFLRTTMPDFPDNEESYAALYQSIQAGEVVLVEKIDEERMGFLVRGGYKSTFIDVRFVYFKEYWEVRAITSVHERPLLRRKSVMAGISALALVIAGLIGFALPRHSSPMTPDSVQSWAVSNGYTLVPQSVPTKRVTPVQHKAAPASKPKPVVKPQVFTFAFKSGMTVHDISSFLMKNHLVPDAYKFDALLKAKGIDKLVRLGAFSFTSGMNETQIMNVLLNKN